MSNRLLPLAFEYEGDLTASEKLVLLYLCNLSNDGKGNYAWPSHTYIAKKSRLSLATVKRACKSLKEKGFITWTKGKYVGGKFKTNHYRVNHNSLRTVVKSNQVSNKAMQKGHHDTSEGIRVSYNNLTNNLTYNLTTLDKLFEQNKDKISLKQKSMAESWTSSYLKSYTQSFEYQRIYCYIVLWLKLGQTQTLWDDFQTGIKSPIEMGWSKGSFCNFH